MFSLLYICFCWRKLSWQGLISSWIVSRKHAQVVEIPEAIVHAKTKHGDPNLLNRQYIVGEMLDILEILTEAS